MHEQTSSLKQSHLVKEDHICSICLTAFYHPVQLATCKHCFCQNCIQDTVILTGDRRCPLCRAVYNPLQVQKMNQFWEEIQLLYPQVVEEKRKTIKAKKLVNLKIGNTTTEIKSEEQNKYKWKLFVKTVQGQKPLKEFAKRVEVNLHPTFHPSKIVFDFSQGNEVEVQRIGWGTFRIGVTVFWKDIYEEKSTEFFHDLDFRPLVEKQIGCYLNENKNESK